MTIEKIKEKKYKLRATTCALLLLAEFILLHFFYSAIYDWSEVRNVVTEVEFGATLISIVLAVVAILYTFWQGTSQTDFNATLMGQLGRLEMVGESLAITNRSLHENMTTSKQISEDLLTLKSDVSSVSLKLSNFDSLQSLFRDKLPATASLDDKTDEAGKSESANTKETRLQDLSILFRSEAAKCSMIFLLSIGKSEGIKFTKHIEHFASLLTKKPEDFTGNGRLVLSGAFTIVYGALRAAGIMIEGTEKFSFDNAVSFEVADEWKPAVQIYLNGLKDKSAEFLQKLNSSKN
ncbi:hypothetical protein [Paraburkholderia phosphatilytica]|uniref:hypothetical protein n=1 Tax=Paraburkholderia phosphatilytica TaxID=2282883 RepID=UPI000E503917|nr:hypothetical protein [Paraburkholderia phosphatilytica]